MILIDEKRNGATYFWADIMNSKEQVKENLENMLQIDIGLSARLVFNNAADFGSWSKSPSQTTATPDTTVGSITLPSFNRCQNDSQFPMFLTAESTSL